METAKLESQLQLLYMQTGNIDVWNKIKARAAEMDRDDAIAARKAKEEEQRQKDLDYLFSKMLCFIMPPTS